METKHVLEVVCRKGNLEALINELFRKRNNKSIALGISQQNAILTVLEGSWNFNNALGIISKEMSQLLNSMDISTKEIVHFEKTCLKIGYSLWKLRCKQRMRFIGTDTLDIPTSQPLSRFIGEHSHCPYLSGKQCCQWTQIVIFVDFGVIINKKSF